MLKFMLNLLGFPSDSDIWEYISTPDSGMLPEEWEEEYNLFLETTDTLGDIDEQWASHYSMIGR